MVLFHRHMPLMVATLGLVQIACGHGYAAPKGNGSMADGGVDVDRPWELRSAQTRAAEHVGGVYWVEAEGFADRYFLNQAEGREDLARRFAAAASRPTVMGSLRKGWFTCLS